MLLACGHEPKPQPPVSVGFTGTITSLCCLYHGKFFQEEERYRKSWRKSTLHHIALGSLIPWILTDISHCGWVLHDMEWSKPHWTYITFSESNSFCCLWGNSDFLFLLNHKGASKKMPEMGFYFGKKYLFSQCPNSHITEIAGAVHPLLFKGWN